MKIEVDTLYLRDLLYRVFRNLEDGEYMNNSGVCCGMLDAEGTAALDDFIKQLEEK